MKLIDPTEDQINAAVAEHVAGWSYETFSNGALPNVKHWKNADGKMVSIYQDGRFTRSADAVLPLLEKGHLCAGFSCDYFGEIGAPSYHRCTLFVGQGERIRGKGLTFAYACCIALLRAKGIQVEFTK